MLQRDGWISMTWCGVAILFGAVASLTGCAAQDAGNRMKRAQAGCVSDHPADEAAYRTARAQCVEDAGNRLLVPTLSPKQAAAKQEVWANDVLLAQQVDAGKITPEQAEALSEGLRVELMGQGS